jgi:hypothetical protein
MAGTVSLAGYGFVGVSSSIVDADSIDAPVPVFVRLVVFWLLGHDALHLPFHYAAPMKILKSSTIEKTTKQR